MQVDSKFIMAPVGASVEFLMMVFTSYCYNPNGVYDGKGGSLEFSGAAYHSCHEEEHRL
jgi:hypothetical protein